LKYKKEDIDFECKKCGKCCEAEGYVYLKKGEIEKIAEYLAKPAKEVKKTFTEFVWFEGRVLKQDPKGCVMLVDGRCAIYEARPGQCSEWPYWKEVLSGDEELEYAMSYCPGIKLKTKKENK